MAISFFVISTIVLLKKFLIATKDEAQLKSLNAFLHGFKFEQIYGQRWLAKTENGTIKKKQKHMSHSHRQIAEIKSSKISCREFCKLEEECQSFLD